MDQSIDRYMNEFIASRHYTIWQLIKSYWRSEQRFLAYIFFAIVMVLTVCLVSIDVIYNYVYYYFYYALFNAPIVMRLFIVSVLFAASYIILGFYRYYISQVVGVRWLVEKFIGHLLKRRGYSLQKKTDQNASAMTTPDQDDVAALIKYSIDMSMCLLGAITTFIFFIYILCALSGDLKIPLGDFGVLHVPYYLAWVGVLYTILGAYFTFQLGRPLIPLRFKPASATGVSARRVMTKKRSSRAKRKRMTVWQRFSERIFHRVQFQHRREKCLVWLSKGYNQAILLLPLFIAWPNFFDKVYFFGGLIQCLYAFGTIQESLLKIVSSYKKIAKSQEMSRRKFVSSKMKKNMMTVRKYPTIYQKFLSQWGVYRQVSSSI